MNTKILTEDEEFDVLLNSKNSAVLLNEMADNAEIEADFEISPMPIAISGDDKNGTV